MSALNRADFRKLNGDDRRRAGLRLIAALAHSLGYLSPSDQFPHREQRQQRELREQYSRSDSSQAAEMFEFNVFVNFCCVFICGCKRMSVNPRLHGA